MESRKKKKKNKEYEVPTSLCYALDLEGRYWGSSSNKIFKISPCISFMIFAIKSRSMVKPAGNRKLSGYRPYTEG